MISKICVNSFLSNRIEHRYLGFIAFGKPQGTTFWLEIKAGKMHFEAIFEKLFYVAFLVYYNWN